MTASPEWLDAHLGPVEAIAIALPDHPATAAWDALLSAVDAHQLRVLDVEFVRRTDTGIERIPASSVGAPADFDGASSELLDVADLDAVTSDLAAGETAAVLLVEHLSMLHVVHSFETAGARMLLDGLLDHDELDDAVGAED
ncbi:hypothetical protein [Micropruina sp.]|jgi:hypothetical protein|uniref:hypothetical protein n=1 Tax=Micropruina sp. TaxID=2737536 RepID=UPI00260A7EF2|nr:hypothetical protein [Micropruina sp.]